MSKAGTMDVINDATTIQNKITNELNITKLPVPEWDYSDNIKWWPGEPLWNNPRYFHYNNAVALEFDAMGDTWNPQYVRPMLDVLDVNELGITVQCEDCGVGWGWSAIEPCWMCGKWYLFKVAQNVWSPVRSMIRRIASFDFEVSLTAMSRSFNDFSLTAISRSFNLVRQSASQFADLGMPQPMTFRPNGLRLLDLESEPLVELGWERVVVDMRRVNEILDPPQRLDRRLKIDMPEVGLMRSYGRFVRLHVPPMPKKVVPLPEMKTKIRVKADLINRAFPTSNHITSQRRRRHI